jgi:hypothetical protein
MHLNGKNEEDLLLATMKRHNIPITLENYLGLAYPEGLPENYGQENHMQLPEEIRQMIDNGDS